MNGIHATSVSVSGEVAVLLGHLTQRDRGLYVSHLVEHRPPPVLDPITERGEITVLRLRLNDNARTKLGALPIGSVSRTVEGYVRDAWRETRDLLAELAGKLAPEQIGLVAQLVGELRPTTPDAVYAAALFGKVEPRWGVSYDTTRALVDPTTAGLFLRLTRVVPSSVEAMLALGLASVVRERGARLAEAAKAAGAGR